MQAKKLHPIEQALADELGPSFAFVITAHETLDRIIANYRNAGHRFHYKLKTQALESGEKQRLVEIEIFEREVSEFFPIIRTGQRAEMDAYREATVQLNHYVREREAKREDARRVALGMPTYAEKMQLRLVN